jgi:colicin import membrane protein
MIQAHSLSGRAPGLRSGGAPAPWRPWMWSAVLHAALVVALAGGVVLSRMTPPAETALALEAVVVDAQTLAELQRLTAPRTVPRTAPPPAQSVPIAPVPLPEARPQPEVRPQPEARPQPSVQRRPDLPPPTPTPAAPAARAAAAAPAPPASAAPARPVPVPAAADTAAREAAERELQAALAEEDRVTALRASGAAAQWGAAIRGRVQRAWIRPDTARSGIDCSVAVTQAPGGTVLAVEVRACNGDDAVRQSIEDAVRRASPLPAPPDPALFEREIILRFRPDA